MMFEFFLVLAVASSLAQQGYNDACGDFCRLDCSDPQCDDGNPCTIDLAVGGDAHYGIAPKACDYLYAAPGTLCNFSFASPPEFGEREGACLRGECIDTSSDRNNCGQLGTRCLVDETCCSGECTDIWNDPEHCGSCDKASSRCANENISCVRGECRLLNPGESCANDAQCVSGTCAVLESQCLAPEPLSCESNADCPPDVECVPALTECARSDSAQGDACTTSEDCLVPPGSSNVVCRALNETSPTVCRVVGGATYVETFSTSEPNNQTPLCPSAEDYNQTNTRLEETWNIPMIFDTEKLGSFQHAFENTAAGDFFSINGTLYAGVEQMVGLAPDVLLSTMISFNEGDGELRRRTGGQLPAQISMSFQGNSFTTNCIMFSNEEIIDVSPAPFEVQDLQPNECVEFSYSISIQKQYSSIVAVMGLREPGDGGEFIEISSTKTYQTSSQCENAILQ